MLSASSTDPQRECGVCVACGRCLRCEDTSVGDHRHRGRMAAWIEAGRRRPPVYMVCSAAVSAWSDRILRCRIWCAYGYAARFHAIWHVLWAYLFAEVYFCEKIDDSRRSGLGFDAYRYAWPRRWRFREDAIIFCVPNRAEANLQTRGGQRGALRLPRPAPGIYIPRCPDASCRHTKNANFDAKFLKFQP